MTAPSLTIALDRRTAERVLQLIRASWVSTVVAQKRAMPELEELIAKMTEALNEIA
jgi:hypothetical protein